MSVNEIAARLFAGWEDGLLRSCLQGHMGRVSVHGGESALAQGGDFCFLAGTPCRELVEQASAPILVPRDEDWARMIQAVLGDQARRFTRYATKQNPGAFRPPHLEALAARLPDGCTLASIGAELVPALMAEDWSRDLCGNFRDGADFARRGLGVAALREGRPVAGASSYCVFDGGIEVEIDTRPDCRRQGLAAACGARLILDCLDRGLYPDWDAHTEISLHLAQRLGYELDHPYPAYWVEKNCRGAQVSSPSRK